MNKGIFLGGGKLHPTSYLQLVIVAEHDIWLRFQTNKDQRTELIPRRTPAYTAPSLSEASDETEFFDFDSQGSKDEPIEMEQDSENEMLRQRVDELQTVI